MNKAKIPNNKFLKSFFNTELYFLADRSAQEQCWSTASGDKFGTTMMLYSLAWETIKENRGKFTFSDQHFAMTQKLDDMLQDFLKKNLFPMRPIEYCVLLNNPDWRKIQVYAKQIYDVINPVI